MGPFPQDDVLAEISPANPAGTDGFAFVEFAHPEPLALEALFTQLGFSCVARHKSQDVTLWRQGDINFILNADNSSFGAGFSRRHGPSAPSMAWRCVDADYALDYAVRRGATPFYGTNKVVDAPAIIGIGGSLLYFLDRKSADGSHYAIDFEWIGHGDHNPQGAGFSYIDHLTHNVRRGNMDTWFKFYVDLFKFREIRFFNIKGRHTGLISRALTSPCGRIRIPINESTDDASQIEEYLRDYGGEGIQHVALGTDNIYRSVDMIAANGVTFMPAPPSTYYEMSHERVPGHRELVEDMRRHGILIDGEGIVDGGDVHLLLQIFSKAVIGPIFFEFIQRKGDEGFGEGNFKALFESIEADQIRRGVLKPAAAE